HRGLTSACPRQLPCSPVPGTSCTRRCVDTRSAQAIPASTTWRRKYRMNRFSAGGAGRSGGQGEGVLGGLVHRSAGERPRIGVPVHPGLVLVAVVAGGRVPGVAGEIHPGG